MTTDNELGREMVDCAKRNTLRAAFDGFTIGYAMAQVAEDGEAVVAIWRDADGYLGDFVANRASKKSGVFLVSCQEEAELYQRGLPEIRRKLRES